MLRYTMIIAATLAIAPFAGANAQAASFDCRKAKTDTEKTICRKATLNVLDQRMAHVYRGLLSLVGHSGQRDQFRADQLYWLNVRDACGTSTPCLRNTLKARIDELSGYVKAVKAAG